MTDKEQDLRECCGQVKPRRPRGRLIDGRFVENSHDCSDASDIAHIGDGSELKRESIEAARNTDSEETGK